MVHNPQFEGKNSCSHCIRESIRSVKYTEPIQEDEDNG